MAEFVGTATLDNRRKISATSSEAKLSGANGSPLTLNAAQRESFQLALSSAGRALSDPGHQHIHAENDAVTNIASQRRQRREEQELAESVKVIKSESPSIVESSAYAEAPSLFSRIFRSLTGSLSDFGQTLGTLFSNLYSLGASSLAVASDALVLTVTNPRKALENVAHAGKIAFSFLEQISSGLGLTDIVGGLFSLDFSRMGRGFSKVGSMLKGVCDTLGLTDIAMGVVTLSPSRLFTGVRKLVWEACGLSDLVEAGKCLLKGDFGGFALHALGAALSFGAIAATVATGGAAAAGLVAVMTGRASIFSAARLVLNTAAKAFFEQAGKDIGQTIAKDIGKSLSGNVIEAAAKSMADSTIKKLTENVLGKVVGGQAGNISEALMEKACQKLSAESVAKVAREEAKKAVTQLLKSAEIEKQVESKVLALLRTCKKSSVADLAKTLEKFGVDSELAVTMAKDAKRAIKFNFKESDEAIKNILVKQISDPIKQKLENDLVDKFSQRLAKGLRGELNDESSKLLSQVIARQAEKSGKSFDDLVKGYTQAGIKGCKEGIEESVEASVRKGVNSAFKEFRKSRWEQFRSEEDADKVAAVKSTDSAPSPLMKPEDIAGFKSLEPSDKKESQIQKTQDVQLRTEVVTSADGRREQFTWKLVPGSERWQLVEYKELGKADQARNDKQVA